jgi:hypothetical protein
LEAIHRAKGDPVLAAAVKTDRFRPTKGSEAFFGDSLWSSGSTDGRRECIPGGSHCWRQHWR